LWGWLVFGLLGHLLNGMEQGFLSLQIGGQTNGQQPSEASLFDRVPSYLREIKLAVN
jgi:hypothetical protein